MIIDLDSRRHGWRADKASCGMCGHRWIAVLHPRAKWYGIECPACGTSAGLVLSVGMEQCKGFEVEPGVMSGCDSEDTGMIDCPTCGAPEYRI